VRDFRKRAEIVTVSIAEAHPRNRDEARARREFPAQDGGGHAFARGVDEAHDDTLLA
jgi:hypothetical protein